MSPRRRFSLPSLPKGSVSPSAIMEKLKTFLGGTGTGFSPSPSKPQQQPMLPPGYFPHLQNRGTMPQPQPPDFTKVIDALSKQMSAIQKNMAVNLLGKLKLQPIPQSSAGAAQPPSGIPGMTGAMGSPNPLSKMNIGQIGTLAGQGDASAIKRLVQELTDRAKKDLDTMKKKMEGLSEGGKTFFRSGIEFAEGVAPGLGRSVDMGVTGVRAGVGVARGGIAAGQAMGGVSGGVVAGAGVAAGAVGVGTGIVGAVGMASVALVKWVGNLTQSNMELSKFSVSMSRVALEHNIRQMRMDRQQGEALAGSTRKLSEAFDSFQQDLQPIKVGVKQAVGGFMTDFINGLRVIKNQTFELGKVDADRRKEAKSKELDLDNVIKDLGAEKWHQQYGRPKRFGGGIGMPSGEDF